MVDVLRESAAHVYSTDIVRYDRDHDGVFDFLNGDDWGAPSSCDFVKAIITNPPYGKGNRDAAKFARIALKRCAGLVALLLTAKFDFGKTRADLFRNNDRFWAKIALVDRIQWFPGDSGGTEDHAWYVWGPKGAAYTPRLLWEGKVAA
jgi:hypothetical protein